KPVVAAGAVRDHDGGGRRRARRHPYRFRVPVAVRARAAPALHAVADSCPGAGLRAAHGLVLRRAGRVRAYLQDPQSGPVRRLEIHAGDAGGRADRAVLRRALHRSPAQQDGGTLMALTILSLAFAAFLLVGLAVAFSVGLASAAAS